VKSAPDKPSLQGQAPSKGLSSFAISARHNASARPEPASMEPPLPVSAFIIARNEADRIGRAIDSVAGWVEEIVVIDSGSTDGTQAVAEAHGARVVHNDWPGYGPQKRFAE